MLKRRGCLLGLLIGVLSLLALPLGGWVYQSLASANDFNQFPPPGQRVDLGGYALHLHCLGSGSPTVLLEAGLGNNLLVWHTVQGELAQSTRVCAYDRGGLGWSDPSPNARDSQALAQELHHLLAAAGEQPPYVLVGHSQGGLHVRVFREQYPTEVAGLVLVDATPPDFADQVPTAEAGRLQQIQTMNTCAQLAPLGVVRLLPMLTYLPSLPAELQATQHTLGSRTPVCATVAAELQAYPTNIAQVRAAAPLGALPLYVLTATPKLPAASELPEGVTLASVEESVQIGLELQQALAALSTNSQFAVLPETGHYIQLEKPEAVVAAVLHILIPLR